MVIKEKNFKKVLLQAKKNWAYCLFFKFIFTDLAPGDGGKYTCVVQNQFGVIEKSGYLSVTGISKS